MREPAVSLSETQFIKASIIKGFRLDGRGMFDFRKISIAFGTEFGVCVASIGNTRAMCQVTASLDRPPETRPNEGRIIFKIELPPLASPSFELGKSAPFSIELNRLLERAIVKSRCVDIEELCVRSGEKCWTLRVEVTALNNEGNLCDVLCLAAVGGLMHFRRPEVTVDGSEVTVHSPEEKAPVKLTLHHKPFTITLGYTGKEGEKYIFLDPCREEQNIIDGTISVAINKHREICALHLSGQSELSANKIMLCVQKAAEKVSVLQSVLDRTLKEDDKQRKKGIIPRLSPDLFQNTDIDDLMLLEEISNVINDIKTASDTIKSESEVITIKSEKIESIESTGCEGEIIVIEDDVVLDDTPSWNDTEKWLNDNIEITIGNTAEMEATTESKFEKVEVKEGSGDEGEEAIVRSEFE